MTDHRAAVYVAQRTAALASLNALQAFVEGMPTPVEGMPTPDDETHISWRRVDALIEINDQLGSLLRLAPLRFVLDAHLDD